VFPVMYELNSYILFIRNTVFIITFSSADAPNFCHVMSRLDSLTIATKAIDFKHVRLQNSDLCLLKHASDHHRPACRPLDPCVLFSLI
jgi:hypothetical protein